MDQLSNSFFDGKLLPRANRLSWHDRHMLEAILASKRSADPNTQVGACIVSPKNKTLSTGYNGFPNKVGTCAFSWARDGEDPLKTKYPFIVHAEKNAIYNSSSSVEGATLYVTMYPCNECAKDIIQSGIKRIIYLSNPYINTWQVKAAEQLFHILDLPATQHKWDKKDIVLSCLQEIVELINSTT